MITNGNATTNSRGRNKLAERASVPHAIIMPRHTIQAIENRSSIAINGRTSIWQGM